MKPGDLVRVYLPGMEAGHSLPSEFSLMRFAGKVGVVVGLFSRYGRGADFKVMFDGTVKVFSESQLKLVEE